MPVLQPSSAETLAEQLKFASQANHRITLLGRNSKHLAAGPVVESDIQISTAALDRVLLHERNDLTISVESGMRFSALQKFLERHEQMIAIDPPFYDESTVGGVLASDYSGPLRRRFGTARDQVIGMTFATVDGRLVKAGGMVVKNVAGLDLAKLMIGSFGTLGAITSVNFRVHPKPKQVQTFLFSFRTLESAIEKRNQILGGVLTPWCIELFSPLTAARLGRRGIVLAVRAAGSSAVLDRYRAELRPEDVLAAQEDANFWRLTSNFTSDFLARNPSGIVIRLRTALSDIPHILQIGSGSYVSHAGSGITDAYFSSWPAVTPLWNMAREKHWDAVVAFSPQATRQERELWLRAATPGASNGFAMMEKIKQMFDPAKLLNRLRLYGCI